MAVQNLKNVGVRDARKTAVSEHGADGLAVRAGAALKSVNHRQSRLAFAQIRRGGLA